MSLANEQPKRDGDPKSLIEQSLGEIWSSILNCYDVRPSENFFAMGGDSLLALVTIEQIKQRLGWDLTLGDLLRYPTIGDLVAHRSQPQIANAERAIVRMSNRGAKPPMIFIHPVGGLIFAYSKLVRSLSPDRGCYGIQSPLLIGLKIPCTVEGIADMYANLILDEFGKEDFHLVGWSFGGVIAFEIAKIATDKALNLKKLVLIDSFIWETPFLKLSDEKTLGNFRADLLAQVLPQNQGQNDTNPGTDAAVVFHEIAAALFGEASGQEEQSRVQFVGRLYKAYRANVCALAGYQPTPALVTGLLLHGPGNYTIDTWRRVIQGQLSIEAINCDHYGLLQERNSALIATHIDAYCS